MKRRDLIKAGFILPLAAATTPAWAGAISRQRKLNILMIVTDQERHWTDIPAEVSLPGHDWLRERGRGFLKHHVHTTPCSPSRSNIYTGLHTQKTGMTSNHGAPPFPEMNKVSTLGHRLRKLGYYTAYKGKWHLSDVGHGGGLSYGVFPSTRDALEPFGFSDFNDDGDPHGVTWTGYKYDPQTASNAIRWFNTQGRNLKGKQPWFMAVNFTNPHDIMYYDDVDGQQERTRLVKDYLSPLSSAPTASPYDKSWEHLPMPASYYGRYEGRQPWSQTSYNDFCDKVYGHIDPDDEARWRRYQSYYFNCLRDADRHLLAVLKGLEASGLLEDTIIVFTADHGEMAGAHRFRQKGPHMFRENMSVPLIISHPEARHGGDTVALSGAIDLVPTILAMAGGRPQAEDDLKGVDLSPVVADANARTLRDEKGILLTYNTSLYVDPRFAERLMLQGDGSPLSLVAASLSLGRAGPSLSNKGFFRGVHEGRYKFARYFAPADHHLPTDWETLNANNELEMFDTANDPYELRNIAYDPAHREKVLALNTMTNALIREEVGIDDGREQPGPGFLYRL